MKTKLISLLLIILLITACHPCKRLMKLCPPEVKDSVNYTETIKTDTLLIKVPGDTIKIEIPISQQDYKLIEENSKQRLMIEILKGKLNVQSTIKEDSLKVPVSNIEKEKITIKTITVEVEKPVIVYKTPKIYKWSFIILIILIILSGAVVFFKIKYKSLKTALNSLK